MRRLPVYLVLDKSYSMAGEPINAVNQGLQALVDMLRQDPFALETVYLSVIEFSSEARHTVPLCDLMTFQPPTLKPDGMTALGAALKLTAERIHEEVQSSSSSSKGDWRPLVFVFTDGVANDDLDTGIQAMKSVSVAKLVGCAAGADVDTGDLQRFATDIVRLNGNDAESIRAFFAWVSASVSMTSQSVESGGSDGSAELPPPPNEIRVINLSKN
ncbi:vWA domain-containing protein [Halomonas sp. CSM-2]|uniref:vWA domain-containing protein n=1 Tax=Halomonas sp. CSM-2 TaxID=1975722 RepID=UPI000A2846F2|nr:VWA domain-containing protein [Halomonas sp. CSM-2]